MKYSHFDAWIYVTFCPGLPGLPSGPGGPLPGEPRGPVSPWKCKIIRNTNIFK